MDNNSTAIGLVDYSRQEAMDRAMRNMHDDAHVIIGCGGVGFWLGIFLAMTGIKQFLLFEGDTIQPSNLNRLPVPQTWVGKNKGIALRTIQRMLRPDVHAVVVKTFMTEDGLGILSQMADKVNFNRIQVWDTTDDARIQRKIYDKCMDMRTSGRSVNYNKIGYEGFEIGSYKEYSVWYDEENYERGYRTSMANVITSAISAGFGIFNEALSANGNNGNCEVDISKLIQKGGNKDEQKKAKRKRNTETARV